MENKEIKKEEVVLEEEVVEEVAENVLKLKKETEINGELVSEIQYDLDSLTGDDVARAIQMLAKHNIVVHVTEIDTNYHAAVFAIASGLDYSDIKRLGARDYMRACNAVRDFFLEE